MGALVATAFTLAGLELKIRQAPLALTEEAIRLLAVTRADFAQVSAAPVRGRGSRIGAVFGRYDFEQVRNQSEYLRMVSIVEAFLDACGDRQFEHRSLGQDEFLRAVIQQARDKSLRTWDDRIAAYARLHGVVLGKCNKWSDIDAAREVRNAIAHGLGTLTKRQRTPSVMEKVRAVSVELLEGRIMVSEQALIRLASSASEFIADVDRQLVLRP